MKRVVLGLLAAVIVTAGCASAKVDKTGKPVRDKPVVLTLADHESSSLDVQNWIDEVQRRSGGTIRIRVENGWRGHDSDYDRATIADVRAGRIDPGPSINAYNREIVRGPSTYIAGVIAGSINLDRVSGRSCGQGVAWLGILRTRPDTQDRRSSTSRQCKQETNPKSRPQTSHYIQ